MRVYSQTIAQLFSYSTPLLKHQQKHTDLYLTLTDFDGLRSALIAINLSSTITYGHERDIITDWQQWKDIFLAAVWDYISSKKLKGRNTIPWMNCTILNVIRKKKSVRRKIKKSSSPYLIEKFRNLRTEIKYLLRDNRNKYFGSLESKIDVNPKRF